MLAGAQGLCDAFYGSRLGMSERSCDARVEHVRGVNEHVHESDKAGETRNPRSVSDSFFGTGLRDAAAVSWYPSPRMTWARDCFFARAWFAATVVWPGCTRNSTVASYSCSFVTRSPPPRGRIGDCVLSANHGRTGRDFRVWACGHCFYLARELSCLSRSGLPPSLRGNGFCTDVLRPSGLPSGSAPPRARIEPRRLRRLCNNRMVLKRFLPGTS